MKSPTLASEATQPLPPVALIVLSWNSRAYLGDCLASLQQSDYPNFSIIVVDNASSDASVAFVQEHFPAVDLIVSPRNLGYGGGNNLGLQRTLEGGAAIAVMVNPDVVVQPDWLRALVGALMADPAIGVAGCKLLAPDHTVIQHAGGLIHPPLGVSEHLGSGVPDTGAHDTLRDVDYVIGAAFAVRREVLEVVGGFDETFFLYYEDVDFCFRTRAAGYRVVYVPAASATHVESVTTRPESQFYLEQMHSGRWRFLLKHTPVTDLLDRTFAAEAAWLNQRSPREQRALVRVYRQILLNLPVLWQHRVVSPQKDESPMSDVSTSHRDQVAEHLAALAQRADQAHTYSFTRAMAGLAEPNRLHLAQRDRALQQNAYIQEQPFTSATPLIGPLLVKLRTLWNNIATTWYVRPLLQQQNDFNARLFQRLEELTAFQLEMYDMMRETHDLLEAVTARAIDDDRDVTHLAHRLGELQAGLTQLARAQSHLAARATPAETGGEHIDAPAPGNGS